MKRVIIISLLLLLAVMCLPVLFVMRTGTAGTLTAAETDEPDVSEALTPAPAETAAIPDGVEDSRFTFTALINGELMEYTLADYLPGALAGEMPVSFETEALMAQAVAARSYIMCLSRSVSVKHPDADVCNDVTCCKAFLTQEELQEKWGGSYTEYWNKICAAVAATDGQYLAYNGQPIQAVFHSSSYGMTEDSGNLWNALPYLVSVDSPETEQEVPNLISTVEISVEDFRQTLSSNYPSSDLSGEPETWIGEVTHFDSGRVEYIVLGGGAVAGSSVRSMFELRSANFTLEYRDGAFLFTVVGYGHGVGMSQYGANIMAKNGSTYSEILAHYYPGTELISP